MKEKIPSFFVESAEKQKENDPQPYDAIISIEEGKDKIHKTPSKTKQLFLFMNDHLK